MASSLDWSLDRKVSISEKCTPAPGKQRKRKETRKKGHVLIEEQTTSGHMLGGENLEGKYTLTKAGRKFLIV